MKPHGCTMQQAPSGRNEFVIQRTDCKYCALNRENLRLANDPQLHKKFVRTGPGLVVLESPLNTDSGRPAEIKIEFSQHREKQSSVRKELNISEIEAPDEIKHTYFH